MNSGTVLTGSIGIAIGIAIGVVAVATDLVRRVVPNWLTVAGVLAGVLFHAATGGWRGLGLAIGGAALGLVVLLPVRMAGAMGGGDLKLMAAFGALLGPPGILLAAVLAAIFGGIWALAWLGFRPRVRAVPYAPAIVLGAWASWIGGGS
jgi:prepilin peptidase CpaA